VDIEGYQDSENIKFSDCDIYGNGGKGFGASNGGNILTGLHIDNCRIYGNGVEYAPGGAFPAPSEEGIELSFGIAATGSYRSTVVSNCTVGGRVETIGGFGIASSLNVAAVLNDLTVTVNDNALYADGDDVGVRLDNGTTHWTTVNGTPTPGAPGVITLTHPIPSAAAIGKSVKNGNRYGDMQIAFSSCQFGSLLPLGYQNIGLYSDGLGAGSRITYSGCHFYGDRNSVDVGIVSIQRQFRSEHIFSGCEIINWNVTDSNPTCFYLLGFEGDTHQAKVVISGCIVQGKRYGMKQVGGYDVYVGGGTLIQNSQLGLWTYPQGGEPALLTVGDVTFKNCSDNGVNGGNYARLGVHGARFLECGERTTLITAAVATDTAMLVDDETGFIAGSPIGVELDSGETHWTTVASVSATPDTVNLTAGIPASKSARIGNRLFIYQDTIGITEASELRGPLADPNTYNALSGGGVKAGKGSTFQSTINGSIWRNTDGFDTWTAM